MTGIGTGTGTAVAAAPAPERGRFFAGFRSGDGESSLRCSWCLVAISFSLCICVLISISVSGIGTTIPSRVTISSRFWIVKPCGLLGTTTWYWGPTRILGLPPSREDTTASETGLSTSALTLAGCPASSRLGQKNRACVSGVSHSSPPSVHRRQRGQSIERHGKNCRRSSPVSSESDIT